MIHTADQPAPFFTTGEPDRGRAWNSSRKRQRRNSGGGGRRERGEERRICRRACSSSRQRSGSPFFTTGEADRGEGLEAQAEDGSPTALSEALHGHGLSRSACSIRRSARSDPGALKPGQAYEFTFTAEPGDRLYFVEMFGQSNDLFFSPDENGIALFSGSGKPIGGTFSGAIRFGTPDGSQSGAVRRVGSGAAPGRAQHRRSRRASSSRFMRSRTASPTRARSARSR